MNRRQRSILCMALLGAVLLLGACGVLRTPAREPLDLALLHTGQVYGEILPCG